eukprot:850677-Prorocentrum_minimum.AAC.4
MPYASARALRPHPGDAQGGVRVQAMLRAAAAAGEARARQAEARARNTGGGGARGPGPRRGGPPAEGERQPHAPHLRAGACERPRGDGEARRPAAEAQGPSGARPPRAACRGETRKRSGRSSPSSQG